MRAPPYAALVCSAEVRSALWRCLMSWARGRPSGDSPCLPGDADPRLVPLLLFEFGVGMGMAAGKQRGDISISCAPRQLIPGNLWHVHVDDREIKARRFNSLQGKAPRPLAPHHGVKFSLKDVSQKIIDAESPQPPISRSWLSPDWGLDGMPFRPIHQVVLCVDRRCHFENRLYMQKEILNMGRPILNCYRSDASSMLWRPDSLFRPT
jgi:hypothetical protein